MKKDINNMTFNKFISIVNSSGKFHSSNAYTSSIPQEYEWEAPFDKTLKEIKRYGIDFVVKEQKTDRWENYKNYIQRDKDGELLRDKNGLAITHTSESIKKYISKEDRFCYEHAIFTKDKGEMVARTQDEWGCLLATINPKYSGFGLGEELVYHHRKKNPFRESGGYTPQGYKCVKKVFRRYVLENLKNGAYKNLPEGRVGEIKKSIDDVKTFKESYPEADSCEKYKMDNPGDILVQVNDRYVIFYNKKIYEILKGDDVDVYSPKIENFLKEGILGYMNTLGSEDDRIFKMHYKNNEIKSKMVSIFCQHNKIDKIQIYNREFKGFKNLGFKMEAGQDFSIIHLDKQKENVNTRLLNSLESITRRKIDPYDEMWYLIHEKAESLAEDNLENKVLKEKESKPVRYRNKI